ncbi:MAG: UPF0175 family protein [Thermomicrobiales bacterium]
MVMVTCELFEDEAQSLGNSPEERGRAVLELVVMDAYRQHRITGSSAARRLGMSLRDFLPYASSRGIPVIDMPMEQWVAELALIEQERAAAGRS